MLLLLLLLLFFFICWVTLAITWVKLAIVKMRIKRVLEINYPEIRNNLTFRSNRLIPNNIGEGSESFLNLLLSFGSTKSAHNFVNYFVDVAAIENTKDLKIISLTNRLIRLNSNFSKIWIVMVVSIVINAIFWNRLVE